MNADDDSGPRRVRSMAPAAELAGRPCPWCPAAARQVSTHVGQLDGRVVVSGCAWHMRLFVQRGEVRAMPEPAARRRRRRA